MEMSSYVSNDCQPFRFPVFSPLYCRTAHLLHHFRFLPFVCTFYLNNGTVVRHSHMTAITLPRSYIYIYIHSNNLYYSDYFLHRYDFSVMQNTYARLCSSYIRDMCIIYCLTSMSAWPYMNWEWRHIFITHRNTRDKWRLLNVTSGLLNKRQRTLITCIRHQWLHLTLSFTFFILYVAHRVHLQVWFGSEYKEQDML
jgi:hypothetical protein